jgi:hypothetical protein
MTGDRNLILILVVIVVAGCVIATMILGKRRKRVASMNTGRSPSRQPKRLERSGQGEALRQNLRLKVTYDEAKVDRLIEFERSELRRKGLGDEGVESLMQRAIARWERENAR